MQILLLDQRILLVMHHFVRLIGKDLLVSSWQAGRESQVNRRVELNLEIKHFQAVLTQVEGNL